MIYHLQNDSELPDNPQKMMDVYNFSLVGEASDPVRNYEISYECIWEKSSFINVFIRVFAQIYANTCHGGK